MGVDTATAEGKRYNDSGVGEALMRVHATTPRSQFYVQLKVHHVKLTSEAEPRVEGNTKRRVMQSFEHGRAHLHLQ